MKIIFTRQLETSTPIKKIFFLCILLLAAVLANAQVLVALSRETFPNSSNTGLAYPVNQNFAGSSGTWALLSTGNATAATLPAPYNANSNALQVSHLSTTGFSASDSYATSAILDLSNPGCFGKYDFTFNLYTYNCKAGDNNAYIAVDVSADGGTTWSTLWQRTSGQIYASYGTNTVANIFVGINASSITGNFKYRFHGHMNAGNPNNFDQLIDEVIVYSYTCGDAMALGNLVWMDTNENGVKDASEAGVPGITVQLLRDNNMDFVNDYDFTPQTTVTDANGNYLFDNLTGGNYKLELVNVNTNHRLVATNAGDPDENVDNNNNGLMQNGSFEYVNGGWITLLPQAEPTNDGDNNNGNLTYDFALYPANPLPVQGILINALLAADNVVINWNTIGEVNTSVFEVERSIDNINYVKIGFTGSTAIYGGNAAYSIVDGIAGITGSAVYYRIKAVDKDGKFTYSNIVAVKLTAKKAITVWPNPFVSDVYITHTAVATGVILIKITDASGKEISKQVKKVQKGKNQFIISHLQKLPQGVYVIDVIDAAAKVHYTEKIIK